VSADPWPIKKGRANDMGQKIIVAINGKNQSVISSPAHSTAFLQLCRWAAFSGRSQAIDTAPSPRPATAQQGRRPRRESRNALCSYSTSQKNDINYFLQFKASVN
jgi:hypothetical protein